MPAQAQHDVEDLCRRLRLRQVCCTFQLCVNTLRNSTVLCKIALDFTHEMMVQVEGALECAKATAEVMRTVVTRRGHATPQALITELTSYGAQLQAAKPHGPSQTALASLACRHVA